MNKHFIITTLFLSVPGLLFPGGGSSKPEKPRDPSKSWGGVATQNLKDGVQILATAISPEKIGKSSEAVSQGFMAGLSDEEIKAKGEKLGAAIVTGALGAVGKAAQAGSIAIKTKAISVASTATAVVTAPATPFIVGGAAVMWFGGYCIGVERQKEYGHCLRTHFDSPSVNEEKMPRRCESPERRARWWSQEDSARQARIYKILKEERRKPRPAVPGLPYWNNDGPNVMGKDDLNNGK